MAIDSRRLTEPEGRMGTMKRAIRFAAAVLCLFTAILAAAPMAMAQNTATLPLVLPAGGARDSLVFIINDTPRSGTIRIHAIDDTGDRRGPVTLSIDANAAARFHSRDLEQGNPARLSSGVGDGVGNWRLEFESSLNFGALTYVRTSDGFLTGMYDKVPVTAGTHHVVFFNPSSNLSKQSRLRLINPGTSSSAITISARDEAGTCARGGLTTLTLPAGDSRTLTSQSLENVFGDGIGKWRLFVTSSAPIEVMSLLSSASGHLSNLSSIPFDATTNTCGSNTDGDHPDTLADAVSVEPGATIHGSIDSPDDVDYFKVRVPSGGATVSFWSTGEADTVITLRDRYGNDLSRASASALARVAELPDNAALADDVLLADDAVFTAKNSGGRVTVESPNWAERVYADLQGRRGGRTGNYALHNEVVESVRENLPPIILRRLSPITLKAGASVNVNLADHFQDPEGASLTYTVSIDGGQVGPISLGINISGSIMSIASPTGMRAGPVSITITASDPFGLFVTQVLTVTIQPTDTTDPGDELNNCVTGSLALDSYETDLCRRVYNDSSVEYKLTLRNSCSYRVSVTFGFNPQRGRPGWSRYATTINPGGIDRTNAFCTLGKPQARYCVYRDDSSRCYGSNPRWRYVN